MRKVVVVKMNGTGSGSRGVIGMGGVMIEMKEEEGAVDVKDGGV